MLIGLGSHARRASQTGLDDLLVAHTGTSKSGPSSPVTEARILTSQRRNESTASPSEAAS